jgi:preprotein translocase subunit SecA
VSSLIARPGAVFGVYPERERIQASWLQQSLERVALLVAERMFPSGREFNRIIRDINAQGDLVSDAKSSELKSRAQRLRQQFSGQGQTNALTVESFALAREVIYRELNLRLSDEQLMAAWAMFKGNLAEMAGGEGKTLAVLLPACAAALAGIPVHVISASDSLAVAKASQLKSVYEALGISMGLVETNTPIGQRRAAYHCDVTYCSSKQVAFDYLQDRVLLRQQSGILRLQLDSLNKNNPLADQLRLRGLCYAIIDDADTILIDESLSPLILSRSGRASRHPEQADGDVIARTTYPRFFQRYVKLCGTASKLRGLATEIHTTYGLRVQPIVASERSQIELAPDQIFADLESKWQAICSNVVDRHSKGQPVLVATRSSEESAHLGQLLSAAGVQHQLVDDCSDESALLLSKAGLHGAVTLASTLSTYSADIALDNTARELGGLHLILSERSRAERIDQRIIGHCARRGEPGSAVAILSLEDGLAQTGLPGWMRPLLQRDLAKSTASLLLMAQKRQQRLDAQARSRLLIADQQRDQLLAFTGRAP